MPVLYLKVESFFNNVTYSYGNLCSKYIINVSKYDNSVLEIGENCLFAKTDIAKLHASNKKNVNGQLTISRKSSAGEEHLKLNNFNENKIGEVFFFQPNEDTNGTVFFEIFLDDNDFELIEKHFLNKIPISHINLEINDFEYGWEPDNSRIIWKPIPTGIDYESYKKDINGFTIVYEGQLKL